MTLPRSLKWIAGAVIAPVVLALLFIAIFGWNWLRAPIERMALEKTGRVLAINGDMRVTLGWPRPRLRANAVTFANPLWTQEKQMLAADAVEITLDLSQLLGRKLVFPELRLERPVVFLEQGTEGRKSWLLDQQQQDPGARVQIDRLTLDQGTLGYDDAVQKTSIRAELASLTPPAGSTADTGLAFNAHGRYKGQALTAQGSGGPVLALRDESTPYPLTIDASVGHTRVRAEGSITSLLKFTAVDLTLALSGDNLAQLYPLLGITFPATRSYVTAGHLLHNGNSWRYEKFSGRIGTSDIAGSLQVKTGGQRPALTAELTSSVLDLADLGPLIGSRPGSVQAAKQAARQLPTEPPQTAAVTPARARVLPDQSFNTERWRSVDAEVGLRAKALKREKELPLEDLMAHLSLKDGLLTLDPLNFGLAGGQLNSVVTLDGRTDPIAAHAKVRARKILLAKLFPTVELNQASIGQINGEFDLAGQGNSVGRMLASSNGKVGLVVSGGEISKLMMEKAGLHLWEILQLSLSGDRLIKLRCAVADFEVKNGKMQTDALVLDTQVTTLIGSGNVDLAQERLDLTFNQKTKATSPLALRSPIYVRGSFAKPELGVDKTRVAVRALGALALGAVNPFLTLLPLIDAGPGQDSDCGQLVRDARALPHPRSQKK
ncbi:AsmA family protein [Rhodoferax ferrireducens]|uniref:AsmA family protein n=1 Tax=Rhodoferax ferrireducens TaxID=192843 RepID=UPI003BB5C42D